MMLYLFNNRIVNSKYLIYRFFLIQLIITICVYVISLSFSILYLIIFQKLTVMHKKTKYNQKSSFDLQKNHQQSHALRSLHDNVDRKCHTPSVYKPHKFSNPKKSLSKNEKQRNKSTDRQRSSLGYNKATRNSEKHIDYSGYLAMNIEKKKSNNEINWKFKNRPNSTLANVRHSKYLEFNLHNLNDSIIKNQPKHADENIMKIKEISHHQLEKTINNRQMNLIVEEGKKYLKNSNFEKAIQHFKEYLKYDPEELQILYLLAICHFHLNNYVESIKYFNSILLKNDNYKKNIYFFLSIAYKRINDITSAIQVLTIVINRSPKYYDALIFRGKLFLKQKKYYQALQDFTKCIKLCPEKVTAYISKADCLRFLMQLNQAINFYSEAMKRMHNQIDPNLLLKRAITYIETNKYIQARTDLQQIIRLEPANSEAYLFKGLVCYKCKNYNDALLSYQQAIKHNSSKKAITKSLYEIAKIKIELSDFYGANYTLERADSLDVDHKVLQKIRLFTDGSTFLMKKKIRRGVQLLTILIKKQNISEYIKPLIYSFRAYGYFCQYKYTHSLNDLQNLQKMGYKLDQASFYNKYLLEGIIHTQNNKYEEAISKFVLAQKLKPNISDAWIYKSLTYICIFNKNRQKSTQFLENILQNALQMINFAIQKQDSNSNAYYLRAVINYTLNDMKQALQDIQKAIDKSDDHVMKHFYLRALIYSSMMLYKQTLNDFGNVISLIKDLKQKEKNITKQQDEQIQIQKQKQMPEAYLNRAKCFLIFGQKKRAFQDLQNYISFKPLDPEIHVLAGRLLFSIGAYEDAVKAYSHYSNIEKNNMILLQRAKCYLLLKQLNHCLKDMEKIVEFGDTKILFDFGCLQSLRQASKGGPQNFEKALKKINSIQDVIKGDGYIFQRADFYFYRGVYHFYLKNFSKSIQNFENSYNLKLSLNTLEDLLQNYEEDQIEENFSNRIYSNHEIKYNIAIAKLLNGQKEEAHKILIAYEQFNDVESVPINQFILCKETIQQATEITPYPVTNRLCSIFPTFNYDNNKLFRLSFCLPKVLPPQIQLKINENLIEKLTINSTQARPDAPWIKRNGFGVVFTQDLIGCDIDLNTQKEKSEKKLDQQEQDTIKDVKRQQKSMEFDNYFHEVEVEKEQRSKIKDFLTLDPEIEARLAKLLKK